MARKKDLAGLAALGALGYALSRGKGGADVPVEDRVGVEADEAPAPTGMGEATKFAASRSLSAAGRTPTAPSRISVDDETGMSRGTRARDARDAEAGMSRGTRSTSMAGAGRGSVNPASVSREPDMSAYVPRRTPQAASSTEEGMRGYVPRRTPGPLTDVDRPGTRVRYENEDTYKKGGKTKKMAAGGRTASQRADGIASKGKTKCKMY